MSLPADDLPTQLETLLGHVRACERWARLDDRIDLMLQHDLAAEQLRRQAARRRELDDRRRRLSP